MLERTVEQPQSQVYSQRLTGVDSLFPCLDGNLALASNQFPHLNGFVNDLLLAVDRLDDPADNAPPLSLDRREITSSEGEFHSPRFTNDAGETLGSASAGDHTKVDLWLAKDGGGRGKDDVAQQGQLTATSKLSEVEMTC